MPRRRLLATIAAIFGAGLVLLISNLELPIVRNSFVYGKAAKSIIERGFSPLPVIADPNLSHGKPIGFSLLSAVFVWVYGVNAGVKAASFVGTTFFLCVATFFFLRLNRRAGIESRFLPLELLLLFFNPLLLYQFWSGYSDSLFAGEVLLAFVLTDILVTEPERDTRPLILVLGLVIYGAILTKFYGAILGLACPGYILLHLRTFLKQSAYLKSKIALLFAVFAALGVAAVLAALGQNPTLEFAEEATEGGGFSRYMTGLAQPSGRALVSSIAMFVFALILNFHLSLYFLLRRAARAAWPLAPTFFAVLYLLGLLPFPGTSYNMRFFVPVFAFVVVAIVSGILDTRRGTRRRLLLAYATLAGLLTLNYNVEPVYRWLRPLNERIAQAKPVLQRRWLDNLRMDQHMALAERIQEINRVVEPDGTLYWVSAYYASATHGVIGELGIRDDVRMRYVHSPSEIPPVDRRIYLTRYFSRAGLSGLEDRFVAKSLGSGVLRLTPLRIELATPAGGHIQPGAPLTFKATASASAETQVARVEFLIDGQLLETDRESPYEFAWRSTGAGRHVAVARVYDTEGNVAASAPLAIFVGIRALERYIARSADDAEELPDGSVYLNSSDLELIEDHQRGEQVVGMRFSDIRISRRTRVKSAYIQFTAAEASQEATSLAIQAELSGDAAVFADLSTSLSSRKRTRAAVKWSPEPWERTGESSLKQRTPDLSGVLEEVIAGQEWQEGNALVLVISGSGRRVARSYDGRREEAPRLYIETW